MPIITNFHTPDEKPIAFTVKLPVSGWSDNVQTITDEARFVETGYAYTVSPVSASYGDYGAASVYAEDVTVAGQMKFHCKKVPKSELTVNVVRTEVEA